MARRNLGLVRGTILPVLAILAVPALGEAQVPFRGSFLGQTVQTSPTANPDVVILNTGGVGEATWLDRYTAATPQLLDLQTGEVVGLHQFTAANGDLLTATFVGRLVVTEAGFLSGQFDASVTGGTGWFYGATGGYAFDIILDPVTLTCIATIEGVLY